MGFLRQTWTLTKKDVKIVVQRRWLSTFLRAVALPVAYSFFIAYVRNFFLPPSDYGIGSPRPIRNLTTEVFGANLSLGGRDRVAFINSGFTGGQIDQLISSLANPLQEAGADVHFLSSDEELLEVCRSSLRGLSRCYGAASFESSPTEGDGGIWQYTARSDFALGLSVYVDRPTNDAQIYVLPFVHAIDTGIAALSGTDFPDIMLEYPFTHETIQEREDEIQGYFMRALARYLAVTLFIGICGIAYHLPGHMASERELGMSTLIDAMIPSRGPWQALTARLGSAYMSFAAIYLPGWIAIGVIASVLMFYSTATSMVVLFHILAGLSLTGYSMVGASLFRRAQLSGITVLLISLVLAILSQFMPQTTTTVAVLSVIFPPITYTSFMIYLAQWEQVLQSANLNQAAPESAISLPGYTFFVFMAVQIIVYPIVAAVLQRALYGTSQKAHTVVEHQAELVTFRTIDVSKHYRSGLSQRFLSIFGISQQDVVKAVDRVSLSALRGHISVLLGSNGAGKSTLFSMMSGMASPTDGSIEIAQGAGLGVCPQHNVLWNDLTVIEHVRIFNGLKSKYKVDSKNQLRDLIIACDLEQKIDAKSRTLSGGQKRKLQLAMSFTAASEFCCIDEVSSGLDPLSRRMIWQILLAERSKRTILMTTHALDEADALSDQIAIMSKGKIIAEGSAIELKHRFGGGYKIVVLDEHVDVDKLHLPNSVTKSSNNAYQVSNSSAAIDLSVHLQKHGIEKFSIVGPTIEDVFLALSEEYRDELSLHNSGAALSSSAAAAFPHSHHPSILDEEKASQTLAQGRGTSFMAQVWILLRKRLLILTRNYIPYFFAIIIPVITAGLATMFLGGFDRLMCSPSQLANNPRRLSLPIVDYWWGVLVPVGPSSRFSPSQLPPLYSTYADRVDLVNDFAEFQSYTRSNFRDVMPGGFYLGDNATAAPVMSYRINGGLGYAALAKNVIDSVLLNTTILAEFSTFALPLIGTTGDSLQLVLYFGFAMCAYPAFFALYPTFERVGNIRALHYSNGIRPGSLWLSYILYDSAFVLLISILAVVMFTSLANVWFAPGYLFVVFLLYGIASTLLAYIISLFTTTQLASFAFAAGGQAIFLLLYFILYMVLITFTGADRLYSDLNTVQFAYALFTPSGNLLRALLLTLNQSQLLCRGQQFVSYPGELTVYGGPILYLLLQILAFYTFLVSYDNGWIKLPMFRRNKTPQQDFEKDTGFVDAAVTAETRRAENSNDALRVSHLTKRFGSNIAVDDVTFAVKHGEILSLLGPNGAGKSTAIDVIRGKTRPSSAQSSVMIENLPVLKSRIAASRFLGVCPQFDTMDRMTVTEHLSFYARARGVPDIVTNVNEVIRAIGLTPFKHRMAAKLSGGNQRKLSLGTAIIGNPSVLLLDEPSSGMDAVAKRIMWKVISSISAGRSMVITTHSMEEASALATRAAIMAKRILAIGDVKGLSEQLGEGVYHVHLFHREGANVADKEVQKVRIWVEQRLGVRWTGKVLHGQFRFTVPRAGLSGRTMREEKKSEDVEVEVEETGASGRDLIRLLRLLEETKAELGIEYYSVSETTLEDVFLSIVGKERGLQEA